MLHALLYNVVAITYIKYLDVPVDVKNWQQEAPL